MKTASIQELKQELKTIPPAECIDLCLRLARFKKENKELLTYLLFEAHDEAGYIESIKQEMDEQFEAINYNRIFFAKKSLRKIARSIGKYCRYTGSATVQVELLLYFCQKMKASGIPLIQNPVILNLYNSQLTKIIKALSSMHEDLQYDYSRKLSALEL